MEGKKRAPSATRAASTKATWADPEIRAKRVAGLQVVAGRKLYTHCSFCGKQLPPRERGKTGKESRFCSKECRSADYRQYHLHRQYGMTNAQYAERLAAQGGVCAICGSDDPKSSGRPRKDGQPTRGSFHVDHDHVTGLVRGLVCSLCNRMLGQGQENADILRAGADYLEAFAASLK